MARKLSKRTELIRAKVTKYLWHLINQEYPKDRDRIIMELVIDTDTYTYDQTVMIFDALRRKK